MNLKEMTKNRALKVGNFVVEFNTPGIGHVLKAAGCDFAFLDLEHSGFGMGTLKASLRFMEAASMPTLVRVPSQAPHHINRALDAGAEGLVVPMVNSAAEAAEFVACAKYPPEGSRGVALSIAHDRYTQGSVKEKFQTANKRTTLFVLIETRGAVEEIDAIAAIDGIDALWLGHFDLSVSLGIPGEFDHPDFLSAEARIEEAAAKAGKSFGRLVTTPEAGTALFARGVDFICYSGDVWLLQEAFRAGSTAIRAACKGPAGAK